MSKTLQKDISFSHMIQMVPAKMNSYLNVPVYCLISWSNVKDQNKIINNYHVPHTHINTRKRR